MINIKRIYDSPSTDDGTRVLVDRLWPRGISKEQAKIDHWLKEIAPGNELRKWFGHDPDKWQDFKNKYKTELDNKKEQVEKLRAIVNKNKNITLLYAAKDEDHNNAVVLKEYLKNQ